jgi:serine O-acetyltransferase
VGIPARILEEEKAKVEARKAKFSAYAVGNDENDPISKAIHDLLEQTSMQAQAIESLQLKLAKMTDAEAEVADAFGEKKQSS